MGLGTGVLRLVSAYLRMSGRWRGHWRLVKPVLGAVRRHGPTLGKATVATRYGFAMDLDLRDWVDQHIFVTGDYEPATAAVLQALLQSGDTCVDAGANVGFFTLLMAGRVGAAGAVWAFEPAPDTRARLQHNVALNRATNVTVRAEALSNIEGHQRFWAGGSDHSGIASLRPLAASSTSYEVRTAPLPACLPGGVVPRLIKMDIEGAERLALEGMIKLLEVSHPDIVIEISDRFLREMGSSAEDVCSTLLGLGYRMHVIEWDGLAPCSKWVSSLPAQFNALFVHRPMPPGLVVKAPKGPVT